MIQPGDRVGVGVSGGADSVALLHLLHSLREELGISLLVAHFNHRLRSEAGADAKFVEELAGSLGIAFIGDEKDVAEAAAARKWNIEDAARRLRYEFFACLVGEGRVTRIAVAHTMDDQAETVLARILRGVGPSGLAAIQPSAGAVVRPLLGIRRAELREYLRGLGQSWREDETNADTGRQRARIRHDLLPVLERDFSPRAVERLANLATLSREEGAFWDALVEDRLAELVNRSKKGIGIPAEKLLTPLPMLRSQIQGAEAQRALTSRLVRRLYKQVRGDLQELTAAHVAQVVRLAERPSGNKTIELPGRVIAARNFGEIVFSEPTAQRQQRTRASAARSYEYPVSLDRGECTEVSVPELGTCFRVKVIDWSSAERETTTWMSILDADRLPAPLFLRSWRPGDAYRPYGRRSERKLTQMFLAARIAASERPGWPVLESAGRVVWARGFAAAHSAAVTESSKAGVLIEERKL